MQERHRFVWFTQCGLRPQEKFPGPSFIISQQMKGYNIQQNPNYQPYRQHLRSRWSLTRGRGRGGCKTQVSATLAGTQICDYNT